MPLGMSAVENQDLKGKIHENPPCLAFSQRRPSEELDEPMSFTISDLYPSFLAEQMV